MVSVTVYDCEFLTAPGAPQRFWCGPADPDPLTLQIGAVRLSLEDPFALSEPQGWLVDPVDRDGRRQPLDPLVTRLTGLDDAMIAQEALPIDAAMRHLDRFSGGGLLYAWGKDELSSLAVSLFVRDLPSPIAAVRFRSAVPLLVAAGEPRDIVETLRSHTICAHFGLPDAGRAHDACGDALSVATVLQKLLVDGRLKPDRLLASSS